MPVGWRTDGVGSPPSMRYTPAQPWLPRLSRMRNNVSARGCFRAVFAPCRAALSSPVRSV